MVGPEVPWKIKLNDDLGLEVKTFCKSEMAILNGVHAEVSPNSS